MISPRAKILAVVGLYAALGIATGIAYGPLAALAVLVVMVGPVFIGVVCSLPDSEDAIRQRLNPQVPSLHPAQTN